MQAIDLGKENIVLNTLILSPDAEETIVMVHGLFGNIAQFYMSIAPELSKDFRIILYDIKSHGKSTCHNTGYDLISLADDIKCLLEVLKIDKCHLLGFSYGALIVLKFAMMFKDRVKKVITLEVPPKSLLPSLLKGAYEFDHFLGFADTLPPLVRQNFMRSKRQVEKNFNMFKYIINKTSFIEDSNLESEFGEEDFKLIEAPVQLLFGKESVCVRELNRIKDWIRFREIFIIDGGHVFFIESPIETLTAIKDFLKKPDSFFSEKRLELTKTGF